MLGLFQNKKNLLRVSLLGTLLCVLIMEQIFRPQHVHLGISHRETVGWDDGLVLNFGVKGMWNSTLFVGGDIERMGFEGEEARGGSRWHFRFQGFVSRSCCGCWVKRRWAAGSLYSQMLYPDWGCPPPPKSQYVFSAPCWCFENNQLWTILAFKTTMGWERI